MTLFGSVKGKSVPDGYAELAFNFYDKDTEVLAYRSISTAVVQDGSYSASLRADNLTEGKEYYVLVTLPNAVPGALQQENRDAIGVVLLQSETPGIQQTGHVNISGTLIAGAIKTNAFQMSTGAASGRVLTSDGSGNGTWQALPPPSGAAGGDLSGTYPNPLVDGLQGYALASTAPATGQVLKWDGSAWSPGIDNDTTYTAGAGLQLMGTTFSIATGGVVSSMLADLSVTTVKIADGAVTDTKLSNTGVSLGTYGSATQVPQFTVNAQGRVTSASNVTISGVSPGGSAGGDLSGTYPNPLVDGLQGWSVASSAPSAGQVLKWNGSEWSPDADLRDAFWQSTGNNIYYNAGNVGIGTSSPLYPLHVVVGTGDRAIWGLHTATTGDAYGVYGQSDSTSGRGVLGWASATSGTNYGVFGRSEGTSGTGVYGLATATSGSNHGLFGQSASTSGRGVVGWATATSGVNYGVYGQSDSLDGYAGYFVGRGYFSGNMGIGTTTPTNLLHIEGAGTNWGGISGFPEVVLRARNTNTNSHTAISVDAQTALDAILYFAENGAPQWDIRSDADTDTFDIRYQAGGANATRFTINSSGNVGIGTSNPAYRLHAETGTGQIALYGNHTATSNTAYGVFGRSSSTTGRGVAGWAAVTSGDAYGVYGQSDSASGTGVYGWASASTGATVGVFGLNYSTTGKGVVGWTNATSGTTYGVYGQSDSTSGTGVFGLATATSGNFTTAGLIGLSGSPWGRGAIGWATATSGFTFGVYGVAYSPDGFAIYSDGNFAATGTKSFQIDHPLRPETHYVNHFCTEGPEPYNAYRGNVVTDARGYATVQLPDYFESINRDPTYHLTVIDDSDDFVLAKVVRKIRNNQFVIRTSKPHVEVSWRVEAVRNDLWVQKHGFKTEQEKPEEYKGKYIHPELYGMPKAYGIHYDHRVEAYGQKSEVRRVSASNHTSSSGSRRVSWQKTR
ncbi:MAG TPA: hypothetical protein VNK96_00445 [Fimbriimonadales bacterium]|nr:hypothetical protein [Fimbriimonadales bacterium]